MEEIESGGELMVPGGWTFLGEERLWAFVWPRRQCSLQQTEKEQSLNFILPLLWLNSGSFRFLWSIVLDLMDNQTWDYSHRTVAS